MCLKYKNKSTWSKIKGHSFNVKQVPSTWIHTFDHQDKELCAFSSLNYIMQGTYLTIGSVGTLWPVPMLKHAVIVLREVNRWVC